MWNELLCVRFQLCKPGASLFRGWWLLVVLCFSSSSALKIVLCSSRRREILHRSRSWCLSFSLHTDILKQELPEGEGKKSLIKWMNASDYSFSESRKVESALKRLVGIQTDASVTICPHCAATLRLFEDCSCMFLISIQLGFFLSHLLISWISDAWLEAIGNIIVIFLTVILSLIFYFKLST